MGFGFGWYYRILSTSMYNVLQYTIYYNYTPKLSYGNPAYSLGLSERKTLKPKLNPEPQTKP